MSIDTVSRSFPASSANSTTAENREASALKKLHFKLIKLKC